MQAWNSRGFVRKGIGVQKKEQRSTKQLSVQPCVAWSSSQDCSK